MTSEARRNQLTDHLLTPEHAAMVIIDYQPTQVDSVKSTDPERMVTNVVRSAEIAVAYGLPIVLSTVAVGQDQRADDQPAQRSTPWRTSHRSNVDQCVGRRRLQEGGGGDRPSETDNGCAMDRGVLGVPGLDAMRDGYETYPIVDAVGARAWRRIRRDSNASTSRGDARERGFDRLRTPAGLVSDRDSPSLRGILSAIEDG